MDFDTPPGMRRLRSAMFFSILVVAALGVGLWRHPPERVNPQTKSVSPASTAYVGAERCAGCHAQASEAWRHSHHAQAMQQANLSTVLGNFRDARFSKDGLTSSFYL